MRKLLSTFLVVLVLALAGAAQVKDSTYNNQRFFFSIEYPSNFLTMQPAPANGDGRVFVSKDKQVEMRAYAQYNALFNSVEARLAEDIKLFGGRVTYKRLLDHSFVISGLKGNLIYYQKTLYHKLKETDVFYTFTIEYTASARKTYDPIVERIASSFRFDPNADV